MLAGDHRSAENRARDTWRHPKETLQFFGFRQDMAVMEVSPGGGGWYTEVLAPTLREHGQYIAAAWDPNSDERVRQEEFEEVRGQARRAARISTTARKSPRCRRRTP